MTLISIPASHESITALKCKKCNTFYHSLIVMKSRPPYVSFSQCRAGSKLQANSMAGQKDLKVLKAIICPDQL